MEEHKNTLHWLPEFRPGMLLEVLTQDNRLLLVGKVDWGQGDTLQLCDCNGMELPYIEYDTEVKLRGFSSAGPFVLKGQVMGNTKEFWSGPCSPRSGGNIFARAAVWRQVRPV